MGEERIRIRVTQDGAKAVRRDIEGLGAGADTASKALGGVSTAIKAVAAVALGKAVQETIRLADAYTDLTNKVRFATRSEQEISSVRAELLRTANANRQSIETTADVYSKLRLSTQSLGLSQREVIELTDTLSKATVLSGASSESAANALRQLGQGMAAGALRGDELNSVLENTPYIADVIAKSVGKTIDEIRQMGAEGKITGKMISDAFKGAREEIVEKFGQRVPKVSEAFTVAGNVLQHLVGEINEATGASTGLARTIIEISEGLDAIVPQIADLAKELFDLSELRGAFDDIFPDMNGDALSTLQFMTLMVSTLEDRLIGALRAFHKLGAFVSGGKVEGSLSDDLKAIVTGQGDVTRRVLDTIDQQRAGARRGVTTVNADPNDPGNTLDKKGPVTAKPPEEKGPTFKSYLADLVRENELLRMNNEQREIEKQLDSAKSTLKGKLSQQQTAILRHQLEENQVQIAINESIEERLKLEVEAIKAEEETQKTYQEILRDLDTELRLSKLSNEERAVATALIDAQAQAQGKLNDEQLRTIEQTIRRNQALIQEDPKVMPKDFEGARDFMGKEFLENFRTFGQEMALIFGPGGTLHQGMNGLVDSMSDVIAQSLVFNRSWDDTVEAIKGVGRMVVTEILSSLIRIPIQMGVNAAIASAIRATETAETVAQAGVITTAMAPAAAATSLATGGANISGATAAIIGAAALATGVLAGAALFEDGGYTGNGGRSQVAGLVHGQEYVLNADATRRYGRSQLDAMNAGTWKGGGGGQVQVTIVNQAPGFEFQTRQVDDGHIEVIARRVVQEMAPDVVANDMRNPQSKTRRALTQTTNAKSVRT